MLSAPAAISRYPRGTKSIRVVVDKDVATYVNFGLISEHTFCLWALRALLDSEHSACSRGANSDSTTVNPSMARDSSVRAELACFLMNTCVLCWSLSRDIFYELAGGVRLFVNRYSERELSSYS